MLKDIALLVRQTFHPDTIKTHHLISPWQVARQEFGNRAKHHHTSLEKLLTQVLQGKNITSNDAASNIVKFIALKHFVPIAVDDVKKIQGEIKFEIAQGDLFYADEKKILGRKLDFWKNKKTLPTSKTKEVLIHFEALPPITTEKIKEITAELVSLLENFCGGKVNGEMAHKKKKWVRFDYI